MDLGKSRVFIASDHAGYFLKKFLIDNLQLVDLGTDTPEKSVDYNDYAKLLIKNVLEDARGILICKTGIGMSIAANRYRRIRAALCYDVDSAKMTREHNNANVLVLSSNVKNPLKIVYTFIITQFSNEERHIRRTNKLDL